MSEQTKALISDYEKHRNKITEHASVGDETPEATRVRFNMIEKDFTHWFDYYFPTFKKHEHR